MKRSDMIRLLCAIINFNTHKTIDAFSGDYLCTLEEADVVLKKLEQLGMLPPSIATNISGWESSKYGIPLYKNEWEPEE